jgi:hypothetical protein
MIMVMSLLREVRMVMRAREILCVHKRLDFICVHREAVLVHKENRIGMCDAEWLCMQ